MLAKSFIGIFVLWVQWQNVAVGQDLATLAGKSPAERLAWVSQFIDEDLNEKDSTAAFSCINQLLNLADNWNAPDIETEVHVGQGNYLLEVLHNPRAALNVYAKGLEIANANHFESTRAGLMIHIACAYRQMDQVTSAYEYYKRAHDIFVQTDFKHIPRIDKYEYEIGRFLFDLDDAHAALEHLSIADLYPSESKRLRYEVLTLIGRCYQNIKQPDKCLEYQKKCLQLARKADDLPWVGQLSVDIGEIYLQVGQYAEARIYLSTGYKSGVQLNNLTLAARALILLSKVNVSEGNFQAAAQKLTEAEKYLEITCDENWFPALYLAWANMYERTSNYRQAYQYRVLYDYVQYPIQRTEDLRRESNFQKRREIRLSYAQFLLGQKKQQRDKLLLLALLLLGVCATIFSFLVFKRIKYQHRTLLLAKQKAEAELEEIIQSKKVFSTVGHEPPPDAVAPDASIIIALPAIPEKTTPQAKTGLEQILQLRLLTDEDSKSFRPTFEKIHPGFFAEIRTKYPDLTLSEIRLLALTKLNLSTKEVSEILNIESNSVRRLRNRIRQKLNLPKGDNFENILTGP